MKNLTQIGRLALLLGLALIFLFPFYWLVLSSFKTQAQIFSLPPQWIPDKLHWENYTGVIKETDLGRAFVNSVVIAVGNVSLTLFFCSLADYAFAKFRDAPGNDKLFAFVLGTMMIPGAVTQIPTFHVFTNLGLVNTYGAMILPGIANAFGIFWMRQYFSTNLPEDLVHAARIDGCSEFGIYWRVGLPIARPALAALGIMTLIGSWNSLMWAFLVLRTREMFTLPVVIYLLQGETRTPYGLLMAGGVLATLPLVLGFLFFQRQFIQGMTAGAVKG